MRLSWKKSFLLSGLLEGWLNMSRRQAVVRSRRRLSARGKRKFETRNSKLEINPKFEIRTSEFELVSSFEFRISSFFLTRPPPRFSRASSFPGMPTFFHDRTSGQSFQCTGKTDRWKHA